MIFSAVFVNTSEVIAIKGYAFVCNILMRAVLYKIFAKKNFSPQKRQKAYLQLSCGKVLIKLFVLLILFSKFTT